MAHRSRGRSCPYPPFCGDGFAPMVVGHADDGNCAHVGMRLEDLFDLPGVDGFSPGLDGPEETVGVIHNEPVSSVIPTRTSGASRPADEMRCSRSGSRRMVWQSRPVRHIVSAPSLIPAI